MTLSEVYLMLFFSHTWHHVKQWIVSSCLGAPATKSDRACWTAAFLRAICRACFFHQRPLPLSILLPSKFPECLLSLFPLCHASLPCPCHARRRAVPSPALAGLRISISHGTRSVCSLFPFPVLLFSVSPGFAIACLVPVLPFTPILQ